MSKIFLVIRLLASFGILLSLFLLWEQFSHSAFQPCNVNSVINCNAVISGPVSITFGVPTPLIGFLGYIVIFLATFWEKRKLILGMATFGLMFCLWIAYQELFLLHVICPVCILCQLDMITVFVLSAVLLKKSLTNNK